MKKIPITENHKYRAGKIEAYKNNITIEEHPIEVCIVASHGYCHCWTLQISNSNKGYPIKK